MQQWLCLITWLNADDVSNRDAALELDSMVLFPLEAEDAVIIGLRWGSWKR